MIHRASLIVYKTSIFYDFIINKAIMDCKKYFQLNLSIFARKLESTHLLTMSSCVVLHVNLKPNSNIHLAYLSTSFITCQWFLSGSTIYLLTTLRLCAKLSLLHAITYIILLIAFCNVSEACASFHEHLMIIDHCLASYVKPKVLEQVLNSTSQIS